MRVEHPKCGICGKPVGKNPWTGKWEHYNFHDYMGLCHWGKPGKPDTTETESTTTDWLGG